MDWIDISVPLRNEMPVFTGDASFHIERAQTIAAQCGCDWTTNLDEVASSDVDAVTVATPDHLHAELGEADVEPDVRLAEHGDADARHRRTR